MAPTGQMVATAGLLKFRRRQKKGRFSTAGDPRRQRSLPGPSVASRAYSGVRKYLRQS